MKFVFYFSTDTPTDHLDSVMLELSAGYKIDFHIWNSIKRLDKSSHLRRKILDCVYSQITFQRKDIDANAWAWAECVDKYDGG